MPVHLDSPVPGVRFDPADFRVRGWLWLEDLHAQIVGVDVHDGNHALGSADAATFFERPDVNAKYGLPARTRTGFEFTAHHPTPGTREPVELILRARLSDGSRTAPLFTRRLVTPPLERDPFQLLRAKVAQDAVGLEIGAHVNPVAGLSPFYTDAVAHYAGAAGRVDFLSDARALPIADGTLDYLCSSHVLEHLPDPIAALLEWHRVLRTGGWLYLVVPDKRFTFDESRPVTPFAHLLRDFEAGTTVQDDMAHVDEFVFQTNWSVLSPQTSVADRPHQQAAAKARYLQALTQGEPIDIHYHTFTPDSLDELLREAGFIGGNAPRFTVLAQADRYPPGRDDGIGLLLARADSVSDPRPPAGTFRLASNVPGRALPLVCPVTLEPLQLSADTTKSIEFLSSPAGIRYPSVDGRPVLLPPKDRKPQRSWGDRSWRTLPDPANHSLPVSPLEATLRSHLDDPAPAATVDPLCFYVRGWAWLGSAQPALQAISAWVGEIKVGETRALYARPDVTAAHGLPSDAQTGFELFAHHPHSIPGQPFELEVRAQLKDERGSPVVFRTTIHPIPRDYRTNHFGVLLQSATTAIQRHDNIFAVGPSQAEGSGELAYLVRRYLGPAPQRVIDVGCGFGSYGRGLLADGYEWIGVEVNPSDCEELARLGLPHRQVDGRTLPFPDASFDAALCLEVLEHIEEPRPFLAEIRRVAPKRLIVSVPNCELLGYLWDHLATPWHMLEATHTNFFTRWSLGALLREFYPHVEVRFHTPYPLRTVEGTPLHYNLLAIASAPDA